MLDVCSIYSCPVLEILFRIEYFPRFSVLRFSLSSGVSVGCLRVGV